MKQEKTNFLKYLTICCLTAFTFSSTAQAWWNAEWTIRKKITVDTTATGGAITNPIGTATVLIRLHDGDFQFASAKDDGSDIRFVMADDKTVLPYHIEKFDGLLNEAFVWVKIPDLKPGSKTDLWLYYGNDKADAAKADSVKASYDKETVLVYHFSEHALPAVDSTASGNNAENAGTPVDGSMIGSGVRFTGKNAITIPASPSLAWSEGASMTWTAWIKPMELSANAVIFSRHEGNSSFVIGIDNGMPYVETKTEAGTQRTPAGTPLATGIWRHLAVVADLSKITIFLDGEPYGAVQSALPAIKSGASLGADSLAAPVDGTPAAATGFNGELDELEISNVARPVGLIQLAALSQGTGEKAAKIIAAGNDESSAKGSENELTKHISLLSDISKSLTPDGWAVIFLCTVLAVVGWGVTVMKLLYLNKVKKGTKVFLKQWEHLSADLSVLDHGDEENIKSMGGVAGAKAQKLMRQSPIYHIYKIGSGEIQHRIDNAQEEFKGLSGRSMQAIRATLDGGLVREVQRLNSNLVFLTIGIAGGPYLGLLGTVIGVMITFAVIAKSGAVEVNSIAPGIAGALLATVAGLAVAIPALFAYSYISSRIKDAVNEMHIFIDEFVAKIAEAFPSTND
ncbi:MAG: DUF2341 domain-containing protein [Chthoniobacteraceae bacterium]